MDKRKVKQIILICVLIVFAGFFVWGRSAEAAEARLGIGFGFTGNKGASYQELMVMDNDLRWYGSVTRIGGDNKHDYQFWRVAVGYRVNWRAGTNFSPFLRLGAVYFDEVPFDYISDHVAFDLAIGFRFWNLVEVEIDQHNSTGGRSNQNEGLDAIMLAIVLPFGK